MAISAYYDPEADSPVYFIVPDPQPSPPESVSQSETESSASDSTIRSDDLTDYFVEHHGRQQPASNNLVRWFPSDNTRRYILRYLVNKWMFGEKYVGPVKEMLSPHPSRQRYALELGTRAGTWTQEMATDFSHVQFRSLDVTPIIAHTPRPNIIFEVYDFTEGLLLEDASQDVVFLNIVLELIRDYRALLREVYRVLRPGGLIHITDFNPHLWDPRNHNAPARDTNPIGCQLLDFAREQMSMMGVDPDTCDKLPQWLAPDSDLWDQTRGARGFERIQSIIKAYPGCPHDGFLCMHKIDSRIAPFVTHLTVTSARDMFSLLRDGGMEAKEADRLVEEMIEEMRRPERCVLFKLYCVYGVKRG